MIESLFKIVTHLKKINLSDNIKKSINYIKIKGVVSTKSKFQLMDIDDEIMKKSSK